MLVYRGRSITPRNLSHPCSVLLAGPGWPTDAKIKIIFRTKRRPIPTNRPEPATIIQADLI
jgi:hypothetical protein